MDRSYTTLGGGNTLRISFFANSRAKQPTATRKFREMEDLWRFFEKEPLRRERKEDVPLFSRGLCDGPRKKANLKGPFVVLLDVDKSRVSMEECSARLKLIGVDHVAYATWSHSPQLGENCYRVLTDLLARDWDALEQITRQLFDDLAIEPTPESWKTPCFFVPAARPRGRAPRTLAAFRDGTTWEPDARSTASGSRDQPPPTADALPLERDLDEDEVRDALSAIPNHDRDTWLQVGMALHSTGHEAARELWDEWSRGQDYPDYSDEAQEAAWRSFGRPGGRGISLSSVFFLATENGWDGNRNGGGRGPRPSARDDFAGEPLPELREGERPRVRMTRNEFLERLNLEYAYVALGQGCVAKTDAPSEPIQLMSRNAFLGLWQHPKFATGRFRADGSAVEESAGKTWLNDFAPRRTYRRLDFLPEGSLPADTLNSWRGWAVTPAEEGEEGTDGYGPWLEHVHEVACAGSDRLYAWTMAWIANLFQRPGTKPRTALVMRGGEGTGKGMLVQPLLRICGVHGVHVSQPSQLTGHFNSHLSGRKLVYADEVTWGGRRKEEGVLKALITESSMLLEPKGVDAYAERSYCGVIISSNNDWVVPAGRFSRRFTVLDVSEKRRGQGKYFERLDRASRGEALRGLMGYLLRLDLDELPDPFEIVPTKALAEQKLASLDDVEQWIVEALRSGEFFPGEGGEWGDWIDADDLYDSYVDQARTTGSGRKSISTLVSVKLKKVFGSGMRSKRFVVDGKRRKRVRLPRLEEARARFESWLGQTMVWK